MLGGGMRVRVRAPVLAVISENVSLLDRWITFNRQGIVG